MQDTIQSFNRESKKMKNLQNNLASAAPEIAKEWHPTLNGNLLPHDFSRSSGKDVWWLCPKGHAYQAKIHNRTSVGTNCPYCTGRKVLSGYNDLATLNPETASEWHPTLNGKHTPSEYTCGSGKSVWWQCLRGHQYQAAICDRTIKKSGCSYCAGKKVLRGYNDLTTVAPEIASEWHPTLNGELMPFDFTKGSQKPVWWQCSQGHEYKASILDRTNKKSGCPYCAGKKVLKGYNDLESLFPKIAAEWHPALNGDSLPSDYTRASSKYVWWLCPQKHEYKAAINSRTEQGSGCPYCSGRIILQGFNDLATVSPEIAAEWHPTLNNEITPYDVTNNSGKEVWWLCPNGHKYTSIINSRTGRGDGCPYCSGKKVLIGFNDLATVEPKVAAEWHPTLNGNLTPSDVTRGCNKDAWWICPRGHVYSAKISNRTINGSGCQLCKSLVKKPEESFAFIHPGLMNEWDWINNYVLCDPYTIGDMCGIDVWWVCKNDNTHSYTMSPKERIMYKTRKKEACPYCKGRRRKKRHFI